ncbi:phosphoribosyltransferase family protein [Mesorhizobium sp. M0965]|uniref:phosphoribosyltransferase n=1 Tax=Mesorhizobium sp. M0965 TaxID=2957036 RepID=UPI003338FE24
MLALPRGGVPVGYEVAQALKAPLDVFVVRKLGVPGHEELAMGAIAPFGVRVLNDEIVSSLAIPPHVIDAVAAKEEKELLRREHLYRNRRPPPQLNGRTIILVDDGLATGSTMRAGIKALRKNHAALSSRPFPSVAPTLATRCGRTPTRSFARRHQSRCSVSGGGTWISHRRAMKRSARSSPGPCPSLPLPTNLPLPKRNWLGTRVRVRRLAPDRHSGGGYGPG